MRITLSELKALVKEMVEGEAEKENVLRFLTFSDSKERVPAWEFIKRVSNNFWNLSDEDQEKINSEYPGWQQEDFNDVLRNAGPMRRDHLRAEVQRLQNEAGDRDNDPWEDADTITQRHEAIDELRRQIKAIDAEQ